MAKNNEIVEKNKVNKADNVELKKVKINDQPTFKAQFKLYTSIIIIFALVLLITYEYNIINIKNLEIQTLKKEYKSVISEVNLVNIDMKNKYNLISVEEYAKQKLGMQKPEKNQIIYVDTRIKDYIENKNEKKGIIQSIIACFK